ncbi:receptor 12 isoform X1 [Chlorella sorokiniana]|uniref:Receptor 12 isoform X1 n=1 Tax=Chlorella sorokiniana TaxID=3076 RepID=A0A2P6U5E3_CHLSO|nr:receptor 12 isoform X1 [Chlorella sorokiniana]|eukprot:PRW61492.1 receptor 12 isoform X1 [Chlorella sorokiniana]
MVSKRWHRVFLTEPGLWAGFEILADDPEQPWGGGARLALLQRVGSMVSSLEIGEEVTEADQAEAVRWVQPRQLEELFVLNAAPQLVEALPRFSCLTLLSLGLTEDYLHPGTAATIRQLPQLLNLTLYSSTLPPHALEAVLACAQLTNLHLSSDEFEQPQALTQLTRLRQLGSLWLLTVSEERLYVPEPAQLPALTSYQFEVNGSQWGSHRGMQVAGCTLHGCSCRAEEAGPAMDWN